MGSTWMFFGATALGAVLIVLILVLDMRNRRFEIWYEDERQNP